MNTYYLGWLLQIPVNFFLDVALVYIMCTLLSSISRNVYEQYVLNRFSDSLILLII